MQVTAYIRVAKNGYKTKLDAGTKENMEPLFTTQYRGQKNFLPTIAFAVRFEVPDELFESASRVIAEINLNTKDAKIAADVIVPQLQARGKEKAKRA